MVSIVIPAYNEEENIGRCLESLISQSTSQDYEVIVVDNASTDKTSDISKKYKDKLNLKIIKEPRKGRGQARFTGCQAAEGDIIISLDGDSIAPVDWIEKMTAPFKDQKIVAVTGTGRIDDCTPRINKSFNILQPAIMIGYRLLFRHFWLTGFNSAVRKDIYKLAGEYNPRLNSNEDTDLAFRVARLGKIKFIILPVTVSGRRFKNGFIKGMFSYLPGFIKQFALKKPADLSDIR